MTPLVRAKGAEVGVRTVAVPHLQSTVSLWTLRLGSELVYNGDIGATEPGPASKRYGVEFANYYSPKPWLIFDGDLSLSRARFVEFDPAGQYVPEAVEHRRLGRRQRRQLPPHVRQPAPALLRPARAGRGQLGAVEGDDAPQRRGRISVGEGACGQPSQIYNLLDAKVSDIDYYFASRLPGEPLGGVEDIHVHPAVPRTLRVSLIFGF